jgi:hypothetical protein
VNAHQRKGGRGESKRSHRYAQRLECETEDKGKNLWTVEHIIPRTDQATYGAQYECYVSNVVRFLLAMKVLLCVREGQDAEPTAIY